MKTKLTEQQKDYICRQLAQFIPHKQIAKTVLARFPEIELSPEEMLRRVKYYSADPDAHQWQQRVEVYRAMLNSELKKHFGLTHSFKRLRVLEKILYESLKPNLHRVLWYPDERDDSGRITYAHKEVYKTDPATAIKAVAMIKRELNDLGSGSAQPALAGENLSSLSDEELRRRVQNKLKLYQELGPIELDDEETAM